MVVVSGVDCVCGMHGMTDVGCGLCDVCVCVCWAHVWYMCIWCVYVCGVYDSQKQASCRAARTVLEGGRQGEPCI